MKESDLFNGSFKKLKGTMRVVIRNQKGTYRVMAQYPHGGSSGSATYLETENVQEAMDAYEDLLRMARL